MLRQFPIPFAVAGTLAADVPFSFAVPDACQLIEISAVAGNVSDAEIAIGRIPPAPDPPTPESDMVFKPIGSTGVPAVFKRTDFMGNEYPVFQKGEVVSVTLDFDGAGGTPAQNVTLLLIFTVS